MGWFELEMKIMSLTSMVKRKKRKIGGHLGRDTWMTRETAGSHLHVRLERGSKIGLVSLVGDMGDMGDGRERRGRGERKKQRDEVFGDKAKTWLDVSPQSGLETRNDDQSRGVRL